MIPPPSEATLLRLARIAVQVEDTLVADHPVDKPRVGLKTARNNRRRAMESILVLIADPELRSYLAELERLGLLSTNG